MVTLLHRRLQLILLSRRKCHIPGVFLNSVHLHFKIIRAVFNRFSIRYHVWKGEIPPRLVFFTELKFVKNEDLWLSKRQGLQFGGPHTIVILITAVIITSHWWNFDKMRPIVFKRCSQSFMYLPFSVFKWCDYKYDETKMFRHICNYY